MTTSAAYDTIVVATTNQAVTVTLNRPARKNAMTDLMLSEMHAALDQAESLPTRLVVIKGANGIFSAGMDLEEAVRVPTIVEDSTPRGAQFFTLLRRLTTISRVVVSMVDGRADGGGVGLAAASDFVLASPRAQFALPEALWGLLPCATAPFLVRRMGFQAPYAMALSTLPINAEEAKRLGLVDEISSDPDIPLRRLASRVTKLETSTIAAAKRYFARLWPISHEVEAAALDELDSLLSSDYVRGSVAGLTGTYRSFPWER